MNILCQDMFFSRSRGTTAPRILAKVLPHGKSSLETLLKWTRGTDQKASIVGEMIISKVKDPIEAEFSQENIKQHLNEAREQSDYTRLLEYMESDGGAAVTADLVQARLNELKGMKDVKESDGLMVRTVPSVVRSSRELVEAQIGHLQHQLDQLNVDVAQAMMERQASQEGLKRLEEDNRGEVEFTETLRGQLRAVDVRMEKLMKKIKYLEDEIEKKKKEKENAEE